MLKVCQLMKRENEAWISRLQLLKTVTIFVTIVLIALTLFKPQYLCRKKRQNCHNSQF